VLILPLRTSLIILAHVHGELVWTEEHEAATPTITSSPSPPASAMLVARRIDGTWLAAGCG
jgi:hypothetical protein